MRRTTFDLDALRSFLLGLELGSFAKAADRVGRSTSAVSAQLKKLETQAGTALVQKSGRGLVVTAAGETMLAYARRLIELNDEAAMAVQEVQLAGWVRLGLQEDFGEGLLSDVLMRFSRAHPKVKIEARVGRNAELLERISNGSLDLALAWGDETETTHADQLAVVPMHWIGLRDRPPQVFSRKGEPVPLVTFDAPCFFRTTAVKALDRVHIPWRNAFFSPNLSGLWAAVQADLGLTIRTGIGLPARLRPLASKEAGLPTLPSLPIALHRSASTLDAPTQAVQEAVLHKAS
jgi:DNA-binding transcriptional LysR family regulator